MVSKPDHLINSTNKLFTVLSIMFNDMLIYGFNSDDLLLSAIISIPKDSWGFTCSSDNYGAFLSLIVNYLILFLFIHIIIIIIIFV